MQSTLTALSAQVPPDNPSLSSRPRPAAVRGSLSLRLPLFRGRYDMGFLAPSSLIFHSIPAGIRLLPLLIFVFPFSIASGAPFSQAGFSLGGRYGPPRRPPFHPLRYPEIWTTSSFPLAFTPTRSPSLSVFTLHSPEVTSAFPKFAPVQNFLNGHRFLNLIAFSLHLPFIEME